MNRLKVDRFNLLSKFEKDMFISALESISQAFEALQEALYEDPFDSAKALQAINMVIEKLQKDLCNDWFNVFRLNLDPSLDQEIIRRFEEVSNITKRIRIKIQSLSNQNPNSN